eukprot:3046298-Rhodomonas_salina.1
MSDLHEYDAASGVWTELTFQATSPGTQPSGRIDMGFVATHGKLYVFGGQAGDSYRQDLHVLNLECTSDDTSGCISCMALGRATPGNEPCLGSDPHNNNLATRGGFGTTAKNTFKREVSNLFAASITESDITIEDVTNTTNHSSLLVVGIRVSYLISGFPSTSEAGTAARRIEQAETQTYLAAVLRFSPDYINLTSLVSTVSGWSSKTERPNPPPANTDSNTVDPAVEGKKGSIGWPRKIPIEAIVGGSFGA